MGSENAMLNYGIMQLKVKAPPRLRPGIQIYKKSSPQRQRLRSVSLRRYVLIRNGHGRKRRARFKFYLQAAYWGNADAQYQCGRMYHERQGLP